MLFFKKGGLKHMQKVSTRVSLPKVGRLARSILFADASIHHLIMVTFLQTLSEISLQMQAFDDLEHRSMSLNACIYY